MRPLLLACALLAAFIPVAAQQPANWATCQAYANLAATQDRAHLDAMYQPLEKSFTVRAIYAERLYAFQTDQRDTTLLNNLPKNGQELQSFYYAIDCAHSLPKPVAHLDALAASFNLYFVDCAQAVVRHPEFMRQFVQMYTQFHATPVNTDLAQQICPIGVYVYLHSRDQLLAALPAAHAAPKDIPHTYDACP